jgi:phosphoribosyl 1,2-cyclic phosphate phosphodiesterase
MQVTLLGCGTSSGVPRIGNDWGDCDPSDPRNRRRRVSLLVEHRGVRVLVDTGPDMREQLLDANVAALDAVIITHDHADHAHGIDDLRQLFHNTGRPVDCYAHPATWRVLRKRFDYVFDGADGYPPTANAHLLPDILSVGALTIRWFAQVHGSIGSTGLRFDAEGASAAYSTDLNGLHDPDEPLLEGLDLWVVDALRRRPHPSHAHLDRTLGWIDRFRPARAVLTHMDNSMDYATLAAELPPRVEPGHDMLRIDLAPRV